MISPTARFSDRVENYIKFRPGYPDSMMGAIAQRCRLAPGSIVADLGSGTGILTEKFLRQGHIVHAVEPNLEMRMAAERSLGSHAGFRSVDATAEATGLDGASIDLVVAGQAFHWFDRQLARAEFERILQPKGWVVLIWNERKVDASPFLSAYEAFVIKHGTDYQTVNHANIDDAALEEFYSPSTFQCVTCFNQQEFDLEGLRGRSLSCSYIPQEGHPGFEPMLADLEALFWRHQIHGRVFFDYETKAYLGQLVNP